MGMLNMTIQRMTIVVALVMLGIAGYCVNASAQTQTQTLRAQWEMEGPPAPAGGARPPFDVATAQSYVYKMYQVGSAVGVTLTGVACTTTADAFIKTCAATVPTTLNAAGLNLDMTATINGIETSHSNAAIVPPVFVPPAPPSNLRMQRYVGTIPVASDAPAATPAK
jgi:hypothetical protein